MRYSIRHLLVLMTAVAVVLTVDNLEITSYVEEVYQVVVLYFSDPTVKGP